MSEPFVHVTDIEGDLTDAERLAYMDPELHVPHADYVLAACMNLTPGPGYGITVTCRADLDGNPALTLQAIDALAGMLMTWRHETIARNALSS